MLERKQFMPVNFLKKEVFTGCHEGMRFRMERTEQENKGETGVYLKVTAWPEPYGFDATPEEAKTWTLLEFSEKGIEAGVDWLNAQQERYSPWPR